MPVDLKISGFMIRTWLCRDPALTIMMKRKEECQGRGYLYPFHPLLQSPADRQGNSLLHIIPDLKHQSFPLTSPSSDANLNNLQTLRKSTSSTTLPQSTSIKKHQRQGNPHLLPDPNTYVARCFECQSNAQGKPRRVVTKDGSSDRDKPDIIPTSQIIHTATFLTQTKRYLQNQPSSIPNPSMVLSPDTHLVFAHKSFSPPQHQWCPTNATAHQPTRP
ncbi:hypothetical protein DER45DRAFT_542542 [Fusarium avenaceum]|nr:hypothetical protein DER45DRAFT_542542 [Fusarium avenaceum]